MARSNFFVTMAKVAILLGTTFDSHDALSEPEWLDWAACVNEAKVQNPQLVASQKSIEQNAANISSSEANFYPQISGDISAQHSTGDEGKIPGQNLATISNILPPPTQDGVWTSGDQYAMGISLKQSLVAHYKDQPLVKKRTADLEASRATLNKTSASVVYDLRVAYTMHLYVQELIELTQKVVDRRSEHLRLVRLKFEGGRENKGSLLRSRASLAQAEADQAASLRALTVAQAQLARALGRMIPRDTRVRGELRLPTLPPAPNWEKAAQMTPPVREAMANNSAAEFNIDGAYAATYPDVSGTVSYKRSGDRWAPDLNRFTIGVQISVPIYTGGRQTADIHGAVADHARTTALVNVARQQVLNDLLQNYSALADGIGKVEVQVQLLDASVLQEELARNQYSLGLTTFQEWDLLENTLIEAERSLLISRRDAMIALAQWDKVLGLTLQEATTL